MPVEFVQIADRAHYRITPAALADWILSRGDSVWWGVDGDWHLMSRVRFPCPAEKLAVVLRRLPGELLIGDPQGKGDGREIESENLAACFESEILGVPVLELCWRGEGGEWLLIQEEPEE